MSILDNWQHWKDFLGDRVEQAENMGVSDDTIASFAKKIGDYLSEHVDPKNDQDRVLKDLWTVAGESERAILARLIMKMVTSDSLNVHQSV
ncbi:MAG: DUF3243 domain-containing protein [Sporolactobacillus sp.]|uniref:DUF3243 domain-containing protein n=1 Tax=Sporolactobacillus sp. STSJ-5 TaxID=2965076 RepID=UPI00210558EB|nr:DUF3243 domain-containing protein [Sporolactobacillus sp. STSJ-5]MCQ2009007.1 DUF3243 domain-containing protein [Sporolactobacillus sp. STSJ-5]